MLGVLPLLSSQIPGFLLLFISYSSGSPSSNSSISTYISYVQEKQPKMAYNQVAITHYATDIDSLEREREWFGISSNLSEMMIVMISPIQEWKMKGIQSPRRTRLLFIPSIISPPPPKKKNPHPLFCFFPSKIKESIVFIQALDRKRRKSCNVKEKKRDRPLENFGTRTR